jgi:hypothetical protein
MQRLPNYPRLQTFGRDARRLLRHPLIQEMGSHYLIFAVRFFVWRFPLAELAPPWFAVEAMHRMILRALRMVDSGRRPRVLYRQLTRYIRRVCVLTRGLFCGHHPPELQDTFCAICQSGENEGGWWYSWKCGHHFHVDCLFAHLAHDTRCPLCRMEM